MSQFSYDVVVSPINKEMVESRLGELRSIHPNGLTNMDDQFGMALLMANFEWAIDNTHEMADAALPEFLKFLFNCQYYDVNHQSKRLVDEEHAISIGVHHQKLQKHFLVQLSADGRRVIHNVHPLNVPSDEFEVEINLADPRTDWKKGAVIANTFRYSAKAKEGEHGEFIDTTWLSNFEGDDLVIVIPGGKPAPLDPVVVFRDAKLKFVQTPRSSLAITERSWIKIYMAAMLAVVRDEFDEEVGVTHIRIQRIKEQLTLIVSDFESMKSGPVAETQDDRLFIEDLRRLSFTYANAYEGMMKKYLKKLAG